VFRRRLLDWYRRNGRDLPWRRTSDPYHILVSEVMLQQTQVDRVVPKYPNGWRSTRRLKRSRAADDGGGAETCGRSAYNVRPRRLQSIARESVWRATGGYCRRTRRPFCRSRASAPIPPGAVMSFAFGQRAAILDTNVARVLFRVFVGAGDPKHTRCAAICGRCPRTVLPMRHVFDFNQALMDFGATRCTARSRSARPAPSSATARRNPFDGANGR